MDDRAIPLASLPVALDLLQMAALVAQQALVTEGWSGVRLTGERSELVLEAWQDVDGAPEACPAIEAAQAHVGGDQAGGGADGHYQTPYCILSCWFSRIPASGMMYTQQTSGVAPVHVSVMTSSVPDVLLDST